MPFDGLSLNRKVEVEPDARCWPIAAAPDRAAMPRGEVILLLPQESPAGGCAGRPLGDEAFLERLKGLVGRVLKPQKGGRPRNQENQEWVTRFCLRDFVKSGAVFSLDYRVDAEGMTPSVGTITTKFPEKPEDFLIEEE